MEMAFSEHLHAMQAAEAHLRLSPDAPLVLPSGNYNPETSYYFGIKPDFRTNGSLMECATRSFVMSRRKPKQAFFLKDTRRVNLPSMGPDGHVYKEVHEKNDLHIAPLDHAADISGHIRTPTSEFVSESWAKPIRKPLQPHRHYRLVLEVIGRRITSFTSTWELISAMRDGIEGTSTAICLFKWCQLTYFVAHRHAYEDAEILHRGISVANLLIIDDSRGVLVDWDLSIQKKDLKGAAIHSEPTVSSPTCPLPESTKDSACRAPGNSCQRNCCKTHATNLCFHPPCKTIWSLFFTC
jgi:hypothetical protein